MDRRSFNRLVGSALACPALAGGASAAAPSLNVAYQPGLSYLPLMVMQHDGLVERHAREFGMNDLAVSWRKFNNGGTMNDALLSGSLQIASGGLPAFLLLWDRTRGRGDVKAVAALNEAPLLLNTSRPDVRSIADIAEGQKIALPAVKVSTNAIVLQMAAAQLWGESEYGRLDRFTVSMSNPDGYAALLSRATEITGHMVAPPFCFDELKQPGIRSILRSYDVLGGQGSLNVVWAAAKFVSENPVMVRAFRAALASANDLIANDARRAAAIYAEAEPSKTTQDELVEQIGRPDVAFSLVPRRSLRFASFMGRIGTIRHTPETWREYFITAAAADAEGS